MKISPALKTLAYKHGMYNRIEPFNDDDGYYVKWYNKLSEYDSIVESIPSKLNFDKVDLKTCDPKQYYNVPAVLNSVKSVMNENYDLSEFKVKVEEILEINKKLGMKFEKLRIEEATEISKTVYIIDVDYENMIDGANIILYCRDVESSETYTLMVRYDDYFYIKLNEFVTEELVKTKTRGFEWYLREQKYKKTVDKADKRQTIENINTYPVTNGGVQYFTKFETINDHKSIYGYRPHNEAFVKVSTKYPNVSKDFFNSIQYKEDTSWEFFEVNIDFVCKFLKEYGISACCAIDFTGKLESANYLTQCDYLVKCSSIKKNTEVAPYVPRMYYWDIECLSLDTNVFPTSDTCPVIQISYLVSHGTEELKRGVLCLKDTPGSDIYESFETEEQLLIRFAQTILQWNPDAIAGFNSNNFDMPYIIDRMKVLRIWDFASCFTRRKGFKMDYIRDVKRSNQFGAKAVTKYISPGFVMFDFMEAIKGDVTIRLRSYSLKAICAEFLHDNNKEELRYKDIPKLFEHPEGRSKIASYCMQDTALLKDLDNVLSLGTKCWGMAQVLGTTPNVVLNRGLVFKLVCKLKEYTIKFKLLMPTFTKATKPTFDGSFEGAFVLEPDVGYHTDPVVTLDFASLYPSLMIGYNLSYDTLVLDMKYVEEHPENFEQHCGEWFSKRDVYKGIIPALEEELAKERNKAKNIRDTFPEGSDQYNVYESLQLANKVIMNSLYGMLGSPTATVPMVQVAKTITGLGRENLLMAKNYVEKNYQRITGENDECKASCIYGDSIMGDTPCIVKKNDQIHILNVLDIALKFKKPGYSWDYMLDDGKETKEFLELDDNLMSWTNDGWTKMDRIIRHRCNKYIVSVETTSSILECTEDHSLFDQNGVQIKPSDCIAGETKLLQRTLTEYDCDVIRSESFTIRLGEYILDKMTGKSYGSIEDTMAATRIKRIHNKIPSRFVYHPKEYTFTIDTKFAKIMGLFIADGDAMTFIGKEGKTINKWFIETTNEEYIGMLSSLFPMFQFVFETTLTTRKFIPKSGHEKHLLGDFIKYNW
jgi:DNA polymerase elongation subunit (family B)